MPKHGQKVASLLFLAWTLEAKNKNSATLKDFATTKPTWEILQDMAHTIVLTQVGIPKLEEEQLSFKDSEICNEQCENTLRQHEYFLLYKELSYAMDHGDSLDQRRLPLRFVQA